MFLLLLLTKYSPDASGGGFANRRLTDLAFGLPPLGESVFQITTTPTLIINISRVSGYIFGIIDIFFFKFWV